MEEERGKVVTLLEMAAKAGVSRMTVSKVMRGVGNISEETRRRVRQAAHELGYLPNSLAGSLSSRTSHQRYRFFRSPERGKRGPSAQRLSDIYWGIAF